MFRSKVSWEAKCSKSLWSKVFQGAKWSGKQSVCQPFHTQYQNDLVFCFQSPPESISFLVLLNCSKSGSVPVLIQRVRGHSTTMWTEFCHFYEYYVYWKIELKRWSMPHLKVLPLQICYYCFWSHIQSLGELESLSPNISTTLLRQCLPFSWTTLRGKHCQHPIAVMGVVEKNT